MISRLAIRLLTRGHMLALSVTVNVLFTLSPPTTSSWAAEEATWNLANPLHSHGALQVCVVFWPIPRRG